MPALSYGTKITCSCTRIHWNPPYGHLIIMATLFWFKNANTAGFLWPAGDWIRVPLKCITLQSLSNGHPQGNG